MEVESIKPVEFFIQNSLVIRVVSKTLIDFDGKVCYHSAEANKAMKVLNAGLLAAALHKELEPADFSKIEDDIVAFAEKNGLSVQEDGEYKIFINVPLAEERCFYKEVDGENVKYDRTLALTNNPMDSLQKALFGTKVFQALES
jgi:hypothetical protein